MEGRRGEEVEGRRGEEVEGRRGEEMEGKRGQEGGGMEGRAFSAKNSTCMRNLCVKITHLDETGWLASGGHIAISCVVACSIYNCLSHMR